MADYKVKVTLDGQDNLSDDLQKVGGELDNIEGGSDNASSSMFDMKNAILATAAAGAILKGIEIAGELNAIGSQANAAQGTFTALSGGAKEASDNLELMRAATRGTVDDMSLQQSASRLLMMNLASTGDEAARLTGLAVTLGKAMGQDATTAAQDFASMLANQSIPRLDNFGISSAAVRDRIEELKQSGMGMEQAFRTAVLEQGALSVQKLGSSAETSATNVDKLNTNIANLKQDIGQGVNVVVNVIAKAANDYLFGDQDQLNAAKAQAKTFVDGYYAMVAEYMDMGAGNTYRTDNVDVFKSAFTNDMSLVYAALENDPTLAQNRQKLYDMLTDMPHSQKDYFIDAMVASREQQISELGNIANNEAIREKNRQAGTAAAQKYLGAFADTWRTTAGDVFSTLHTMGVAADPANLEAMRAEREAIAEANAELTTFNNSFSDIPTITNIMDETQTGTLSMMLGDAKTQLGDIQEAAKAGILQDSDVTKAQQMVDEMQGMQDKITAIQGMTLGGLLGTSNGGAMGELEAKIMAQARGEGSGLTEKQIADLESTLDLATGKSTASSQTLDEQIVPMIAEIADKLGPDAAAVAMKNVTDYIKQGNYLGLDQTTIAAGLDEALGFTKTGSKYDRTGDGAQYTQVGGFDPVEYANSLGESKDSMALLATDSGTMADNMTVVGTQMSEATGKAKGLETTIARMAANTYTIKVNLDISGLDKLNAAGIGSGGGGNGTSTNPNNTRNNGGRVLGHDPRAD